ncbi:MAG: thioredoxin [Candidatus Altiarchaeales archaeon WOR_SM1_79]|nr:MAG: thioredoxin [Candidatus Altiarchaeales archaeon WOR_SM1_79]
MENLNKQNKEKMDYPGKPIKLSDEIFAETIEKYPLVVVDFWAEWCAPCRMIAPVIDELAEDLFGKVVFGKMNIDENRSVAGQFSVSGIPTLLVFKKGQLVERIVGAVPKESIIAKLQPLMLLSE